MTRFAALFAAACLAASGAAALDLPAGARLARELTRTGDTYPVPVAAFRNETVASLALRGPVQTQAWHLPDSSLTTFQAIDMLRSQLFEDGYAPAFDCAADACGGFDFRFAIDVLDAPDMFVNLRDFHFATLLRVPNGVPEAAVTILVSRTRNRMYIQITTVNAVPDTPIAVQAAAPVVAVPSPSKTEGGIDALLIRGFAVLDGLEFETGATTLGPGPFQVLETLAAVLTDNPGLRVALVGHTDSIGALDGNVRISQQRAQAARTRLIERYGIASSRLDAEGMGYLAPRASNLTPSGREANRRVEVVVLSAD